ncbi:hypothetical protein EPN87_00405 [archaeon]|nr:MAG: hypothetical protein EPN87_00405 [archaeon]
MKYKTEDKINGYSVRVEVEWDNVIKKIRITGDFFAYPESVIEKIEEKLAGLSAEAWESSLLSRINDAIEEEKGRLVGISMMDISKLVKRAVS